jgi:hypothetical protein
MPEILFSAKNILVFHSTLGGMPLFVMEVNAAQRLFACHKG